MSFLQNGGTRAKDFLVRKYGPWPIITLAAFLTATGLVMWGENIAASQWDAFKYGLRTLLAMSVGFWGLMVFLLLLAFVVLSFVDTSPTVEAIRNWQHKRPKPVQLTDDDKLMIQEIRVLWNKSGQDAAYKLHYLFEGMREKGQQGEFWWIGGIRDRGNDLKAAEDNLTAALAGGVVLPLEEVVSRFRKVYDRYIAVAFWVYDLNRHGLKLNAREQPKTWGREVADMYADWRTANKAFSEGFEKINEWPALQSQLKVHANDEGVRAFLANHDDIPPPPLPLGTPW